MSTDYDAFITAIQTFLASNIGVAQIRHPDGRTLTLDRAQAIAELNYWQTQKTAAANSGLSWSRFGLKGDA